MNDLIEEIRAALVYDPATGVITRNGRVAGCDKGNGYWRVTFKGKTYAAHRLAWAIYYGEWPDGEIDHINRVRGDNRIGNLRIVSREQNMRNRSGVAGVAIERNRWRAYIWTNGRLLHLGMFGCFGRAITARRKAEADIWGR